MDKGYEKYSGTPLGWEKPKLNQSKNSDKNSILNFMAQN
jgi:hypothetical protein